MSLVFEEDISNNLSTDYTIPGNDGQLLENEMSDDDYLDEDEDPCNNEMLKRICIQLPDVPSQTHMCETILSRPPSDDVKQKIDRCGVQMKVGKFNPVEDKIIIKNWESFSMEYMVDDPSLFFSLKGVSLAERIKFAQYLGQNLPHRYLYAILMRFINLYKSKIVGKFSEKADKVLLKHMKKHKVPNYVKLSKILDRDKHSIYRRCQLLKKIEVIPELRQKLKWNYELVDKLLRSMLNVFHIDDIALLKKKTILFGHWVQIEKDCGIPARRAKVVWLRKLYTQIFAVNRITKNEIYIKLIDIFYEKKYKYWQDIEWNEVVGYFDDGDGMTTLFLGYRWKLLVRKFVPKEKRRKLRKTVKLLKSRKAEIENSKNYILEKLTYTKSEGLKIKRYLEKL